MDFVLLAAGSHGRFWRQGENCLFKEGWVPVSLHRLLPQGARLSSPVLFMPHCEASTSNTLLDVCVCVCVLYNTGESGKKDK